MFKSFYAFLLITALPVVATAQEKKQNIIRDSMAVVNPGSVQVGGFIGNKISLCIANRIAVQNVDELVAPFYKRTETKLWQTEFWGKWVLSAIAAEQYQHNDQLLSKISRSASRIMASQSADGYIGNYADTARLRRWDVWGQKYTLLGLLAYYDLTGKSNVLRTACKLGDYLIAAIGPGKTPIVKTSLFRGMPSCSVLEPIVLLYRRTRNPKYLEFAKYVVRQIESPEGAQLTAKALAGIPVGRRFPLAPNWNSWENGEKAYEMMSCYDGMLELYKATGDSAYLKPVVLAARSIAETELTVAGGASASECWYGGRQNQVRPSLLAMETCVTQTWIKLCTRLMAITGDAVYADDIEQSYYNALLAAMTPDGASFAKYTALSGFRTLGEQQCGMNINCCTANGPRGMMQFPYAAVMNNANTIFINLYAKLSATVKLTSGKVRIDEQTDYPQTDSIVINVSPEKPAAFSMNLHIPRWSAVAEVWVNGEKVAAKPGSYLPIWRHWKKGDKILLRFDLNGRVSNINGYVAIQRGPVLLARDSRFVPADFIDEEGVPLPAGTTLKLRETKSNKPAGMWMAFEAPFRMGSDHELKSGQRLIPFTDFSSAGNDWNDHTRLRSWLLTPFDPKRNTR